MLIYFNQNYDHEDLASLCSFKILAVVDLGGFLSASLVPLLLLASAASYISCLHLLPVSASHLQPASRLCLLHVPVSYPHPVFLCMCLLPSACVPTAACIPLFPACACSGIAACLPSSACFPLPATSACFPLFPVSACPRTSAGLASSACFHLPACLPLPAFAGVHPFIGERLALLLRLHSHWLLLFACC